MPITKMPLRQGVSWCIKQTQPRLADGAVPASSPRPCTIPSLLGQFVSTQRLEFRSPVRGLADEPDDEGPGLAAPSPSFSTAGSLRVPCSSPPPESQALSCLGPGTGPHRLSPGLLQEPPNWSCCSLVPQSTLAQQLE